MTIGSHQRCVGKSQEHITPKWIIDALGPFDLDPCESYQQPWKCAAHCIRDPGGLTIPWPTHYFVWLNPPFNRYEVGAWIEKLAEHGNGIALLHARTEAAWFEPCWRKARSMLFLADRIKFCRVDGSEQPANSGAPVVLVAFGPKAHNRLLQCRIPGYIVRRWLSSEPTNLVLGCSAG